MTAGTLLDQYLSSKTSLTDEQMALQLQSQQVPSPAAQKQPQKSSRDTGISPQTQLALDEVFERLEEAAEDDQAIDKAVKTATSSVKVLVPLLVSISKWVDPADNPAEVERIMGQALAKVGRDSIAVAAAFGVDPQAVPPWLASQISGELMEVMIAAIGRNNGALLDPKRNGYIAPIINLARSAGGLSNSTYANPTSLTLKLSKDLAFATAEVMTEYYRFSYFQPDSELVAQTISDYVYERVIDGTLKNLAARFHLNESEKGLYGGELLRGAGKLLADAWSRNVASTMEYVKTLSVEDRRDVLISGYPLDVILADFEKSFQGLEISSASAIRALSPHREVSFRAKKNA